MLGTPAYMSPEQVNGKKVDGRADIFSLGVTLYEMVTGEKPFAAETIAALLYRIANVEHSDPREFNKKLPAEMVNIINKALAKDADKRYQTAGEMGTDLRQLIRGLLQTAAEPKAPVEAPKAVPADRARGATNRRGGRARGAVPSAAGRTSRRARPKNAGPRRSNKMSSRRRFSIPQDIPTAADVESNNQVSDALRDAFSFGKVEHPERASKPRSHDRWQTPPLDVKPFTESDFLSDLKKAYEPAVRRRACARQGADPLQGGAEQRRARRTTPPKTLSSTRSTRTKRFRPKAGRRPHRATTPRA